MSTLLPLLVQQQQMGGALVLDQTPSQYATYSVKVAWDGEDFEGTYSELVGMEGHGVRSVRIRRGRDDELGEMVAGEADIVIHDPDGRFNPQNAASPLAGEILPMRPVAITASNDGGATTHPLFTGYIRSVEHDPQLGVQETRLNCIDLFVWLQRTRPVIPELPISGIFTSEAITALIEESGFVVESLIDIVGGDIIGDDYSTDGSRSALEEINELLVTERGVFYITADGRPKYEPRGRRAIKTSQATFDDTMMAARAGTDLDSIGNRARVTRTGGVEQEASDAASQAMYGVADIASIESPYLLTDLQAASLASYLVGLYKDPRPPVYGLDLMNRDVTTMDQILARELQDRITVSESRGGTDGDFFIEGIEHEITDGGKFHRCRWRLSSAGVAEAFVVGASTVGGADVISY